jgi:HlyD family secretion protein
MRAKSLKRAMGLVLATLILIGVAWFAWPRPIPVDLADVARGPMEVNVDDEAKTRVRNIYTVSAPLAGKVLRSPRRVGDEVVADESIVAAMQPAMPSFLDVRSREELQAVVYATEAAVKFGEAEVRRIEAALDYSRTELDRAQTLFRTSAIAAKVLDKARFDAQTNEAALASAKAQLDVRRHEHHNATARLMDPGSAAPQNPNCCIQIAAPVSGRVLKISQESEAVVQAGAPLLEIGNPRDLEIVADLLSSDAVQIAAGASVRIDGWGGRSIQGRVARVDPAGFAKVSALGIEEQRVRTTIDLVDPPEVWAQLGHDYRVVVHVTTWSANEVLTVPVGALFRKGEDWAVFTIRDGRARTTIVQIGRRNNRVAQVLSGLSTGDRVVLHASDRIAEGVAVLAREPG